MSYYEYDNSYMLDTIRNFPGVFSGVAVIDENAGTESGRIGYLNPQSVVQKK